MNDIHHRRVALIKRPPLVRSSSPASCYKGIKQKKSVRFCDSLETVRLFLKTDKPQACQSDASSTPLAYQLCLPNWPRSNQQPGIRLEKLQLISNQLQGTCQVSNLAFEKHVTIHYTLDDWLTVKQVDAVYQESIAATTWDRFRFKIVLPTMEEQTLKLAANYRVAGRTFWDNNDKKNYTAHIIPDKVPLDDSSSDDDDDEHTFDDCSMQEDKQELSLLLHGNEYHFRKPWSSPLLSPTTPEDMNPLWSIHSPIKPMHYMHSTSLPSLS